MTNKELQNSISQGENHNIGFKKSFNKQAIETIVAFSNTKGSEIFVGLNHTGKTTQRTENFEYPLPAIRELVLNAIIHRDYQSPTDI